MRIAALYEQLGSLFKRNARLCYRYFFLSKLIFWVFGLAQHRKKKNFFIGDIILRPLGYLPTVGILRSWESGVSHGIQNKKSCALVKVISPAITQIFCL